MKNLVLRALHFAYGPAVTMPLFIWGSWLALMAWGQRWHLFADGWMMSLTMAFGSFIAGSTSEGGGAIAFPAMTLLFEIEPSVARDFSFMIQSVGMTAAAATIFRRGIRVEHSTLVFASAGGAVGVILGIELVAPLLDPTSTKIFFVSLWLSFGLALMWMNRSRDRQVFDRIQRPGALERTALLGFGLVGGMVSGVTGSGLDIVTFSLLTLSFTIDEKVATPTSVVLMAGNALVGFGWRMVASAEPIAPETWNYWWVCVPVVVVGAPLGVRFIADRSSFFVAALLCSIVIVQFVGALVVLPLSQGLYVLVGATFGSGLVLYSSMAALGIVRSR